MIMIARMLSMESVEIPQLNSSKIEKTSEKFIEILNDDIKCTELFNTVVEIFHQSELDLSKRQFKAESESDLLISKLKLKLEK